MPLVEGTTFATSSTNEESKLLAAAPNDGIKIEILEQYASPGRQPGGEGSKACAPPQCWWTNSISTLAKPVQLSLRYNVAPHPGRGCGPLNGRQEAARAPPLGADSLVDQGPQDRPQYNQRTR